VDVRGYEVCGEIARGGMGIVYAAREVALDREVAVKVLLPGAGADEAARRFVTEARVTARLPHPNVPPVYSLGAMPDGSPCLAMKLIRGRTLADLLAERPDPSADLPRFVAVFEQVCQAVAFAHSQGVVHRDLKPSNVMVGSFGEVQVMDWGLAKVLIDAPDPEPPGGGPPVTPDLDPPAPHQTVAGSVLGTPAYMPPEQARGELIDERADVFALGGILCAILTGRPPFDAGDPGGTLRRAAAGDLADTRRRLAACGADAELVGIADRCLRVSRGERAPDGGEVARLVAAYRAGVEERLRRAERERAAAEARVAEEARTRRAVAERAAERRRRRRAQLLSAGAVGLLGVAAGAFAWWQDRQAERAKVARAELDREHAERRAEQAAHERDWAVRSEQTRQGVDAALRQAADLRRGYRFDQARAALALAERLASGGGADDLRPAVERAQADLAFVEELDGVRMDRSVWVSGKDGPGGFAPTDAPARYRKAFLARGFDLAAGDPDRLADLLQASAVKAELVDALDDWSTVEPAWPLQPKLLVVARRADPGPWTDRIRDVVVRLGGPALDRLAADVGSHLAEVSPAAVAMFARLLERRGRDPSGLLLAAQAYHPDEFRLAYALGLWYLGRDPRQAVGPLRAAWAIRPGDYSVATNLGACHQALGEHRAAVPCRWAAARLRPDLAPAQNNLGTALYDSGDLDGAIAAFRRAVELDPRLVAAHTNLGSALLGKRDVAGAVACQRRAVELDPRSAPAHNNLANALLKAGDLAGAVAACRRAVELAPREPLARANLGHRLEDAGDLDGAIAEYKEAVRLAPRDPRWRGPLDAALAEQARRDARTAPPPRAVRR
jgi:tetratricopeptide (TPR) repeat protein